MQPRRRRIDPGKVAARDQWCCSLVPQQRRSSGLRLVAPPLRALAWVVTAVIVATTLFVAQLVGLPIQPAFKFLVSAGSAAKHALVR